MQITIRRRTAALTLAAAAVLTVAGATGASACTHGVPVTPPAKHCTHVTPTPTPSTSTSSASPSTSTSVSAA